MIRFFPRRLLRPAILFIFLDLLAVSAGMGVPFFPILFGFVTGWFAPTVLAYAAPPMRKLMRQCLAIALVTATFTCLVMLVLWLPSARMLFDPQADYVNFGIPMILYQPKASYIGWMVLMIVISPALQALTGTFASLVRIAFFPPAWLREA
jgi:hypothetical protein